MKFQGASPAHVLSLGESQSAGTCAVWYNTEQVAVTLWYGIPYVPRAHFEKCCSKIFARATSEPAQLQGFSLGAVQRSDSLLYLSLCFTPTSIKAIQDPNTCFCSDPCFGENASLVNNPSWNKTTEESDKLADFISPFGGWKATPNTGRDSLSTIQTYPPLVSLQKYLLFFSAL